MRLPLSSRLAASVLSLALAACGGGGESGPPPAPLSAATFQGLYVEASVAGGFDEFTGSAAKVTGDGVSRMTGGGAENDSGVIEPLSVDWPYTVAADGTMAVPLGGGVDLLRGGVSADGESALLGSTAGGFFSPGILAFLRRDGGYDAATVEGSFHSVLYATVFPSRVTFSVTGPATLAAGDGLATSLTRNTMGTVTGSSYAFAYDVFLDGTARVTESSTGATLDGAFVRAGSIGLFGGAVAPAGALPAMQVLVRTSTGASPATFAGSYWFVALLRDPVTRQFRSLAGSAELDGVGAWSWTATENLEGVITLGVTGTGTYGVVADGSATLGTPYGSMSGGVSEDGRFAALGGGTSAGDSPAIWLFARK